MGDVERVGLPMGKGWGFKLVMGGEGWGDGWKGVGLQVCGKVYLGMLILRTHIRPYTHTDIPSHPQVLW